MSLLDIPGEDTWLRDFEYFGILLGDIKNATARRRQLLITSPEHSTITSDLRKKLPQAELQLSTLVHSLEDSGNRRIYNLGPGELDRRRRLCSNMQSALKNASDEFYSGFARQGSYNRVADLGTVEWGEVESDATRPLTNSELKIQQKDIVKEQDAALESLSGVIQSQKRISKAIHSEVEDQDELLIDIKDRVDDTQTAIQQQTTNISQVSRKSTTCGYWVIIIALLAAIVIVSIW